VPDFATRAIRACWWYGLILSLAALLVLAPHAAAAPCPQRGGLDARYCDRDGDLVADLPTNPADWLDPATLIFSYTPVEDPAVYEAVWRGFLQHLSRVTGRRVLYYPVQSNAAQRRALRDGRIHVAGVNTGGNPLAVDCAGFVPFAMMAEADGSYGYEMEIIVPASSPIRTPADLTGRTLMFTSPDSNSGYKAPRALLEAEFSLVADRDFKASFSGKHDNSIRGVASGEYEAAAIANSVLERMIGRRSVDPTAIRSIYRSHTFPTTGYGHVHNLQPQLAKKIREAFASFVWEGSALAQEFRPWSRFIPIDHRKDWAIVRQIDAVSEQRRDCPS
jgi:phosphonate transport system substrate-binding protein